MKLLLLLSIMFITASCDFEATEPSDGIFINHKEITPEIDFSLTADSIITSTFITFSIESSSLIDKISISSDCSTRNWTDFSNPVVYSDFQLNANNSVKIIVKDGNGNISSCKSHFFIHDNIKPTIPSSLSNSGDASDIASETISWTNSSDTGSGINSHLMLISTSSSEADSVTSWVSVDNNPFQVQNLTLSTGTTYYTLIKSIDNANNESDITVSNPWSIIVSPEKITNLETSARTISSISLGWSTPLDNGTLITDYIIEYKESISNEWIVFSDSVSAATGVIVDNLSVETSYDFRVKAWNGVNYSAWSNTHVEITLPNVEFFAETYKAINIGGAKASQVVSIENGNTITIKDVSSNTENSITLNKGETHSFTSEEFDIITAQGPFFVAGRLGSIGAGASDKANITWSTSSWVGKSFFVNLTRNEPMTLKIFAFEDSIVSITSNGLPIDSSSLIAENGGTLSLTSQGSYEISSTGLVSIYAYASLYADPRPLLPASTDIIGFPSSKAMITSSTNNNDIELIHSNTITSTTQTISMGTTLEVSPQGTSSLFNSNALRIRGVSPVVANSNADSNGLCSAPFVPISMLKKNFAINVDSDFVAFSSDRPVTITITYPDQSTGEISLQKTGTHDKAPYYGRVATSLAGTIFSGDNKFQAWYQPNSDNFGADEDETILFGWD